MTDVINAFVYSGNKNACAELNGIALEELRKFKQELSFQNLSTAKKELRFQSGITITLEMNFGLAKISTHVPELVEPETVKEPQTIDVYWTSALGSFEMPITSELSWTQGRTLGQKGLIHKDEEKKEIYTTRIGINDSDPDSPLYTFTPGIGLNSGSQQNQNTVDWQSAISPDGKIDVVSYLGPKQRYGNAGIQNYGWDAINSGNVAYVGLPYSETIDINGIRIDIKQTLGNEWSSAVIGACLKRIGYAIDVYVIIKNVYGYTSINTYRDNSRYYTPGGYDPSIHYEGFLMKARLPPDFEERGEPIDMHGDYDELDNPYGWKLLGKIPFIEDPPTTYYNPYLDETHSLAQLYYQTGFHQDVAGICPSAIANCFFNQSATKFVQRVVTSDIWREVSFDENGITNIELFDGFWNDGFSPLENLYENTSVKGWVGTEEKFSNTGFKWTFPKTTAGVTLAMDYKDDVLRALVYSRKIKAYEKEVTTREEYDCNDGSNPDYSLKYGYNETHSFETSVFFANVKTSDNISIATTMNHDATFKHYQESPCSGSSAPSILNEEGESRQSSTGFEGLDRYYSDSKYNFFYGEDDKRVNCSRSCLANPFVMSDGADDDDLGYQYVMGACGQGAVLWADIRYDAICYQNILQNMDREELDVGYRWTSDEVIYQWAVKINGEIKGGGELYQTILDNEIFGHDPQISSEDPYLLFWSHRGINVWHTRSIECFLGRDSDWNFYQGRGYSFSVLGDDIIIGEYAGLMLRRSDGFFYDVVPKGTHRERRFICKVIPIELNTIINERTGRDPALTYYNMYSTMTNSVIKKTIEIDWSEQ